MGWNDTHGTIAQYNKRVRDEQLHKQLLAARKKVIEDRNAAAASGLRIADSPSGRKRRACIRGADDVRKTAAKIVSYNREGRRMQAPSRAFVELEHWDEQLDGKLDPTLIVEHKGMNGVWRSHGRKGVHVEENFEELGWEEEHLEADDTGPLGAERMKSRRGLLTSSMANAEQAHAAVTAQGPVQDALALIKSLGVLPGAAPSDVAGSALTTIDSD